MFTKKGYAAARTRDIADEAGINLALLNYYFRSKERLFEAIMLEKISLLFGRLRPIFFNSDLDLKEMLELIAEQYIDLLVDNPDLPIFVMSELRNNPERFLQQVPADEMLRNSYFIKHLSKRRPDVNPVHFLMSLLGMLIFPFVMKPMFIRVGQMSEDVFKSVMNERKRMIPIWIESMLSDK